MDKRLKAGECGVRARILSISTSILHIQPDVDVNPIMRNNDCE